MQMERGRLLAAPSHTLGQMKEEERAASAVDPVEGLETLLQAQKVVAPKLAPSVFPRGYDFDLTGEGWCWQQRQVAAAVQL